MNPKSAVAAATAWLAAALLAGASLYLVPDPASLYVAPAAASLVALAASSPLVAAAYAGLGGLTAYAIIVAASLHAAGASAALRLVGVTPLILGGLHVFLLSSGLAVVIRRAWGKVRPRKVGSEG